MNSMSEIHFAALQGVAKNDRYPIESRFASLMQAFEMLSEHVDELTESFKKFEEVSNMENFKEKVKEKAKEVTRVFTFGVGHPKYAKRFVEITAETGNHCRCEMLNHFGNDWAFEYASRDRAGVNKYGLTELPKNEWPEKRDNWKIDSEGWIVENV